MQGESGPWRPRLVAVGIDGTLLRADGRVPRSVSVAVSS